MGSETAKFRQEHRRKRRLREITTHIILLSLVFMYAYCGAKLFQSIEEKNEEIAKGNLIKSKHHFLELIKSGIGSPMVDQKNWTRMVDRLLSYYVEDLAEATSHGVDITDVTQHEYESESKWDFWGSLFYAGTVFTTIGYGNFAPVTPEGKVATIIYGSIGIPLCLILLADLGNLIAKVIKYTVKKMKKHIYVRSKKNLRELWPPQDEIDSMSGKSSLLVLCIVCGLYFTFGTFMYKTWEENWSHLDAVYFIFVSTSTVGFGDVLPSQPKKFIFTSIYIFFGLSLLSSGFTIIQEILESKITGAKTDLDSALGIEKTENESIRSTLLSPEPMPKSESMTASESMSVSEENVSSAVPTPEEKITPSSSSATEGVPVVEETIGQNFSSNNQQSAPKPSEVAKGKRTDNNNLFFAPNARYEETARSNVRLRKPLAGYPIRTGTTRTPPENKVNETKVVSLDDGILSVEATIVLD